MSLRPLLFLLVILMAFVSPSPALEFRVISWEGEISGLYFVSGHKPVEIMADEAMFSSVYKCKDSTPLVLFREVLQEGKTVRVPVVTLTPPDGLTQALLVLSATDASHTNYTGLWIDDSREARPPQTITFRNLSSHSVAIRFGKTDLTLPANDFSTLPIDAGMNRVPFKMAALVGADWQLVACSSQEVRPGRRTLVLLRNGLPKAAGLQDIVDMITINDRLPPPPMASSGSPVASP